MLDPKEAYKILGVSDSASKDEIVKRYDVILKKHKINSQSGQKEEFDLEKVSEAYNYLMGYENMQPEVPYRSNPVLGPICRKLKLDEKKVANYIHYYKVHVIVGLIALIIIISGVRGCMNKVDPDFYLTTIGNIYIADTEMVEKDLQTLLPDIKAPMLEALYITGEEMSEQNYAMQMKAMTLLAAGDMDVIIMDKRNYEMYAKQGALIKLDELAQELNIDMEKNKDLIIKPGEDTLEELEEGLYGIDISNSEFVKRNNIKGKECIASIKVNPKHKEKALEMLKLLLEVK